MNYTSAQHNFIFELGRTSQPLDIAGIEQAIEVIIDSFCDRVEMIRIDDHNVRLNVWGLADQYHRSVQMQLESASGANQFGTSSLKAGVEPDQVELYPLEDES